MTAQLSQERIEQYLQSAEGAKISSFDSGKLIAVEPDYVIAMCRMALAGMDSEPRAYLFWPESDPGRGFIVDDDKDPAHKPGEVDFEGLHWVSAPLYTTPPAPVAVDEIAEQAGVDPAITDAYMQGYHDSEARKTAPVAVPDEMTKSLASIAKEYQTTPQNALYIVVGWNACRAAMLKAGPVTAATVPEALASSVKYLPVDINDMRFVVRPDCGNKRCPHANDHRNACTGSNEPGQEGSAYPAAPEQEV